MEHPEQSDRSPTPKLAISPTAHTRQSASLGYPHLPPSTTQSTGPGHGRPPHPRPRAIPEVSTSTPSCPCLGYRWPLHHPAARSSLNQALYTCSTSLLQPIWDLSGLLTPKRGHYRIRECTSLSFKNNSPELIYSPNVIFELI